MPIRVSLTGSRWTPADPEAEGCLITELHCIPNNEYAELSRIEYLGQEANE